MRARRIMVAADHHQQTFSAVLPNGGNLLGDPGALTGIGNAAQPGPLGLGGNANAVQNSPASRMFSSAIPATILIVCSPTPDGGRPRRPSARSSTPRSTRHSCHGLPP